MVFDGYSIEKDFEFENSNNQFLKQLYLPIIGTKAFMLYKFFAKKFSIKNNINSIKNLCFLLGIDVFNFEKTRKKLEAVGLIVTYKSDFFKRFIFQIHKPLNIMSFKKNSLLYKTLINKIGLAQFENYFFETKNIVLDKSEYKNISANFFTIFNYESNFNNNEKVVQNDLFDNISTNEINIPQYNSNDEYIEKLSPVQFIKYITGIKAHPNQVQFISTLYNIGFLEPSINLIFFKTIEKTGKLVISYAEKVKNTLLKNGLISYEDVKSHFQWINTNDIILPHDKSLEVNLDKTKDLLSKNSNNDKTSIEESIDFFNKNF